MRTCGLDDCESNVFGRGMCNKHYMRWRRWGDPNVVNGRGSKRGDPFVRFWEKVDKTDACWLWNGTVNRHGYGIFCVGPDRFPAHKWILFDGNPPKNGPGTWDVDHLCRVRNCVRPDHLEFVTHAENIRR